MGDYYITTEDETRLEMWRKLFRSYRLPVKQDKPRWQFLPGKVLEVLAYDLDASRLTPKQKVKFSGYIAKVYELSPEQAALQMNNWPIEAKNCHLLAERVIDEGGC